MNPWTHTGNPSKYLPLSFHLPHIFKDLCSRRRHAADNQTAWLLASHSRSRPSHRLLGPTGVDDLQLDLHEELSDAINEPLSVLATSQALVKTSLTHPIKWGLFIFRQPCLIAKLHPVLSVTCLVPPPLLAILAANSNATAELYPTRLRAPQNLSIHNLIVAQSIALLSSGLSAYEIERFVNGHKTGVSLSLNVSCHTSAMPILVAKPSADKSTPTAPPSLGNMFMSSCPGKKGSPV